MDFRFEADIVRALGRIYANDHLVKGAKPVHWCTDCGSALAEAEVEYENKTSPAIDVRFRVACEETLWARCEVIPGHAGAGPVSVVIWTTTPWTLPANQAVALGPDVDYVIVECPEPHERLLIAESLLRDVMDRYDIENYRIVAHVKGLALEGLRCSTRSTRARSPSSLASTSLWTRGPALSTPRLAMARKTMWWGSAITSMSTTRWMTMANSCPVHPCSPGSMW